jgi:hypothetical protein
MLPLKFRARLVAVFRIEGRGSLLVFGHPWSGQIKAGEMVRVGGIEILVRGFNLHRPKDFEGPIRASMLVGEGHHEHLLASIGEDVEGV